MINRDDFVLDGSEFSRDDLETLRAEFVGGGPLDGKSVCFGVAIVPDSIAASFSGASHEYVLRSPACDSDFEARFCYDNGDTN